MLFLVSGLGRASVEEADNPIQAVRQRIRHDVPPKGAEYRVESDDDYRRWTLHVNPTNFLGVDVVGVDVEFQAPTVNSKSRMKRIAIQKKGR